MSFLYRIMLHLLGIAEMTGLIRLAAKGFRYVATTGVGSNSCLKEGFLPVPVHFYSPIPDLDDLRQRDIWSKVSSLNGINFRNEEQVNLLREIGARFGKECRWAQEADGNPETFFLNNPSFSFGCAASVHCMIRHFKPERVIEVGAGMSTRVVRDALQKNADESGRMANYHVVDPYPSPATQSLMAEKLIVQRAELLDRNFFQQLAANDILFIDSSHSVKIGSDVNYLFLEVMPMLAPGVIVHVHDISLPYEYARVYATNPAFRQFWTEQYLLQAFLSCNDHFEVLLAMHYLMTDHKDLFKEIFPLYDSQQCAVSGSFWMQRKRMKTGDN